MSDEIKKRRNQAPLILKAVSDINYGIRRAESLNEEQKSILLDYAFSIYHDSDYNFTADELLTCLLDDLGVDTLYNYLDHSCTHELDFELRESVDSKVNGMVVLRGSGDASTKFAENYYFRKEQDDVGSDSRSE